MHQADFIGPQFFRNFRCGEIAKDNSFKA